MSYIHFYLNQSENATGGLKKKNPFNKFRDNCKHKCICAYGHCINIELFGYFLILSWLDFVS